MEIVPNWNTQSGISLNATLKSAGREKLLVLDPGEKCWADTKWFRYLHELTEAIPVILHEGWRHEWPTYRMIPPEFKEQWFLKLAEKYTWDPKHTFTMWLYVNQVARAIFRDEMRLLRRIWARNGDKPDWMIRRVWDALVDMFEELGTNDVLYF